ncbi:hypothetical protein ACFV2B_36490 [Streptomyces lavendulae]|uniref:hypothetical protein n=1 Tax=Streptomyces lavendulae TaxID=1914 RepID=UPI003689812F
MEHHLVAEETEPGSGSVKKWHVVRGGQQEPMCERDMVLSDKVQSTEAWGTPAAIPFCHACGASFLREVP